MRHVEGALCQNLGVWNLIISSNNIPDKANIVPRDNTRFQDGGRQNRKQQYYISALETARNEIPPVIELRVDQCQHMSVCCLSN